MASGPIEMSAVAGPPAAAFLFGVPKTPALPGVFDNLNPCHVIAI
jgi:hypothetical protein